MVALSADAGFCRDSGKLEDAIERMRDIALQSIDDGVYIYIPAHAKLASSQLWRCLGMNQCLRTHGTSPCTAFSATRLRHSKKLGACGLSQKSKRRRPPIAPPEVLDLPLSAYIPFEVPPITTATLALIALAEQRYKLDSQISYLQRSPFCHSS